MILHPSPGRGGLVPELSPRTGLSCGTPMHSPDSRLVLMENPPAGTVKHCPPTGNGHAWRPLGSWHDRLNPQRNGRHPVSVGLRTDLGQQCSGRSPDRAGGLTASSPCGSVRGQEPCAQHSRRCEVRSPAHNILPLPTSLEITGG
jgi:hypothetical protein